MGYPPRARFRRRCRRAYFFVGLFAGVILSVVTAGFFYLWYLDSHNAEDPVFEIIAVSWGTHRPDSDPFYQAVVKARYLPKSGNYEVTADILMGPSTYTRPVGVLGTVGLKRQALEKFGVIRWTREEVTFGSETTVAVSVKRSELEIGR